MINLQTNLNLFSTLSRVNEILPSKEKLPSAQSLFSISTSFLKTGTENVCKSITKWSGIDGITNGVKAIRNGEVTNGLYQIATNGMPIVLLTAFVTAVAFKKISEFDFNKETFNSVNSMKEKADNINNFINEKGISTIFPSCTLFEENNTPPIKILKPAPSPMDLDILDNDIDKNESPKPAPSPINLDVLDNDIDNNGIPIALSSQIHLENSNEQIGKRKITLISAYDDGIKDYAQHVIPNQQAYAAKQGYNYVAYSGNLAHDQGVQRAPYWSKIVALNDQLKKTKEGEWLVWGDASAIFTNTNKNFDEIIDKHGQNKDIIVTTDPQVPINNAVFIIKNTPWTKEWIKEVWSRSDLALGGKGNCWSWGQPFCHYEQQAMTELWQKSRDVQDHTAQIPNNVMNSFYRYSHYDPYRHINQNYEQDSEDSKWHSGDFVCKVTGMDKDHRLKIIQYVTENCIDQPCEFKKFSSGF